MYVKPSANTPAALRKKAYEREQAAKAAALAAANKAALAKIAASVSA